MQNAFSVSILVAYACLAVVACGGQDSPDVPGDIVLTDIADSGATDGDTGELSADTACVPTLEFVGEPGSIEYGADIVMARTATRTIALAYDGCQEKADVAIELELLDGQHSCELQVNTVYTDSGGMAAFTVASDNTTGMCHVQACVGGREDACVTVTVMVAGGCGPPLMVMFDPYDGRWADSVNAVKLRLIRQTGDAGIKCSDIDPRSLPGGDLDSNWSYLNEVVQFTSLPNLKTELQQQYTIIATAYEFESDEGPRNPLRAWACSDSDGHVEYGSSTTVVLDLVDLAPTIVGNWDIESTFDLTGNLPPQVENALNVLFRLLSNPVDELLLMMCDETVFGIPIAPDFCAMLFTDPAAPSAAGYTDFGAYVAGMIDAIMTQMMLEACPFTQNPEICTDVYYTAQDTGTPLSDVVLLSTMNCDVDPGLAVAGLAEIGQGDCTETWHTVVYRWMLGLQCGADDTECGIIPVSLADVPGFGQVVQGDIFGGLVDGQALQIDSHLVGLKQGALIRFAIESIILPRIFGDSDGGKAPVNSIGDLVGALLGYRDCVACGNCCDVFETAVLSQYPETPAGLARDACQALSNQLSGFVEVQLASLDAGGGILIGTPAAHPATMYDTDDDMRFDTIGNAADACQWEAVVQTGGFDYTIDGSFWGMR